MVSTVSTVLIPPNKKPGLPTGFFRLRFLRIFLRSRFPKFGIFALLRWHGEHLFRQFAKLSLIWIGHERNT